jgi:hypothetical protein
VSFDLFVFVPTLPSDLISKWERILAAYGLDCQFYPGYHPSTWHDCFAPVQVTVDPTAFPSARLYGVEPLLSEIELDDMDVQAGEYADLKTSALRIVRPDLYEALAHTTRCIQLSSSAGRTLIQFRLQCFTAATLTVMTEGILLDPQPGGGYFSAATAIHHAAQRADSYEQDADPDDWNLARFTTWSAWDGELPTGTADEVTPPP